VYLHELVREPMEIKVLDYKLSIIKQVLDYKLSIHENKNVVHECRPWRGCQWYVEMDYKLSIHENKNVVHEEVVNDM
jgi:hypothetical protein